MNHAKIALIRSVRRLPLGAALLQSAAARARRMSPVHRYSLCLSHYQKAYSLRTRYTTVFRPLAGNNEYYLTGSPVSECKNNTGCNHLSQMIEKRLYIGNIQLEQCSVLHKSISYELSDLFSASSFFLLNLFQLSTSFI